MDKRKILEIIKELQNYKFKFDNNDRPIVIVGPDATKCNKLRVYAYGGCIGRISTTRRAKAGLIKKDYLKYIEDDSKRKILESKLQEKDKDAVLTNPDYLRTALAAAFGRWHKGEEKEEFRERKVQTEIVKKYMKHSDAWCVVDMEFYPKRDWGIGNGKPDLVVFDRLSGKLGLIELKYQNKSCGNLLKHYKDFKMIYDNPVNFNWEMARRIHFLLEYGLIDEKYRSDICKALGTPEQPKDTPVWFGFLFVGGSREGAQTHVNNYLFEKMSKDPQVKEEYPIDECFFQYVENAGELEQNGLCASQMQGFWEFINEERKNG